MKSAIAPILSSSVAIGIYTTWVVQPDVLSVASQRGLKMVGAASRPAPRVFSEGIRIAMNREAPPVAALEEALRKEPWSPIESSLKPRREAEPVQLQVGQTQLASLIVAALAPAVREPLQSLPVSAVPPQRVQPVKQAVSARATESERAKQSVAAATAPVAAQTFSREQVLAALFGMIVQSNPTERPAQTMPRATDQSAGRLHQSVAQTALSQRPTQVPRQLFAKSNQALSDEEAELSAQGSHVIRGHIELTNGLAITNSRDKVVVSRIWKGRAHEAGSVWIRDGKYEIYVDQLIGTLSAELRSPGGALLGRGAVDLQTVAPLGRSRRIDDLALKLTPIQSGVVVRPIQSDSNAKAKLVYSGPGAIEKRSTDRGEIIDQSLADGTITYGSFQRKGFVDTAVPLVAGKELTYSPVSEGRFKALVEKAALATPASKAVAQTVVQFRVHRAGVPVHGVQIEPLTEDSGTVLTEEPKSSDRALSNSGVAHFVGALPGTHFFMVRRDKATSDPIAVEVFDGMVTDIELDLSIANRTSVHAFDVFDPSQASLPANVRPLGHPRARVVHFDPEEDKEMKIANLGQPTILDIDSGPGYVPMRVVHSPLSNQITAPFIQRAWLDSLIGFLKFNPPKDSGIVVGFVQQGRYQVELSAEARNESVTRVVYLSPRGEPLDQNFGVAGGGFLILGVKSGLQSLTIQSDVSDKKFVMDVLVEPGLLSTLTHWVR